MLKKQSNTQRCLFLSWTFELPLSVFVILFFLSSAPPPPTFPLPITTLFVCVRRKGAAGCQRGGVKRPGGIWTLPSCQADCLPPQWNIYLHFPIPPSLLLPGLRREPRREEGRPSTSVSLGLLPFFIAALAVSAIASPPLYSSQWRAAAHLWSHGATPRPSISWWSSPFRQPLALLADPPLHLISLSYLLYYIYIVARKVGIRYFFFIAAKQNKTWLFYFHLGHKMRSSHLVISDKWWTEGRIIGVWKNNYSSFMGNRADTEQSNIGRVQPLLSWGPLLCLSPPLPGGGAVVPSQLSSYCPQGQLLEVQQLVTVPSWDCTILPK